jgi:N-acetyl-1-D-myo-inositol-2-amino-2-deoxy-alpha-D-glucopyranoside deacetylase
MPDVPTLLCVHPHPDDESIACGGLLAATVAAGRRAVVVTCTGGEEGENLAGIDLGDEDLVSHRRRELADALAALGVEEHHWLGYRDSGMAGTAANDHPDSFHRAPLDEAAARLANLIRQVRPHVVVSDDEQGTYGHPDHVRAHLVTIRAVELAADPTADLPGEPWQVGKRYVHALGRSRLERMHRALTDAGLASPFGSADLAATEIPFGVDDDRITTEVDVRDVLARKRAAMAAHRSQIGADSFFLNLPDGLMRDAFAVEQFVLEQGPTPASLPETDLFAGIDGAEPVVAAPVAPVDPAAFRATLGRFATGVGVMTVAVQGRTHGMTANAISSVSLDPPLVLVCVERSAAMATFVRRAPSFALSFLAADQQELSDWFADPARADDGEQFAEVAHRTEVTGTPILDGAVGWVDCRVEAIHVAGDHDIVIGRVVGLGTGRTDDPLLYYGSAYHRLAE